MAITSNPEVEHCMLRRSSISGKRQKHEPLFFLKPGSRFC